MFDSPVHDNDGDDDLVLTTVAAAAAVDDAGFELWLFALFDTTGPVVTELGNALIGL